MQNAKEQVRQSIDIVDLIGSYMSLRRQGRGYVALCPWHDDSRPSLQVNPERQSFKCWVCDIGGDIFSFMMRMEGLEFREALEMLADRAGISLAPSQRTSEKDSQFDRKNLLKVMAWAEQQFHNSLLKMDNAEPARRYLADRGFSAESIDRFRLGFAPASWDWLLRAGQEAGWSPEVLERVGLVGRRSSGEGYYDRFRGRLIFSIRDVSSRPIAFGGRVLPGVGKENPDRPEAKYINSPETPLFSKSSQLYALDLARNGITDQQGLVVMEGYTDVIMAHQHGITNAVAVLGTALTDRHIPLVRRFTDQLTLVLDGDEAGQRRTEQILNDLLALFVAQEIDLKILALPEEADPCDVIASQGSDAFRQYLSTSVDALEHKIQAVTNGLASAPGTHSGTHKASQAVEEILGVVARAFPTGASSSSATLVREQQVLSQLERRFGIGEETLRSRLAARRRELAAKSHMQTSRATPDESVLPAQRIELTAWESELLELLLHHPDVLPRLADTLLPEDIPSQACRDFYHRALETMHAGLIPSFEQLMLATDDPEAKNLLVLCDERGHGKSSSDVEHRITDLLAGIARREQTQSHQSQFAELNQNRLDPEHELEVLNELYHDFKRRQTGSKPTDG